MSLLAGVVLLMTASTATGSPVCIHRLAADLRQASVACAQVDGDILDAHALRGGGVTLLVKPPDGRGIDVTRWTGEAGTAPERHRLDLDGGFLASRSRSDDDLVVVTGSGVARVRNGAIVQRRTFAVPPGSTAAATPDGAWVLSRGQLAWAGLDGSERTLKGAWPAPRWRAGPEAPPDAPAPAILVPTSTSDVVVVEEFWEEHPVEGYTPDVTNTLLVTRVDREGRTVGEVRIGDVRTSREWFWTEKSSSNPTFIPDRFGLVRKRWTGTATFWALAERPDGGVVLALQLDRKRETTLRSFDGTMRERWTRRLDERPPQAASPPWAPGLLFADASGDVWACDDDGRVRLTGGFPFPEAFGDRAPKGVSIGRTPAGDWFVVRW